MSKHLDVTEFESNHPNIDLLETLGTGDWRIELYLDKDSNEYFSKGPFGRWDAICYVKLDKVKSKEGAKNWVEEMKANM